MKSVFLRESTYIFVYMHVIGMKKNNLLKFCKLIIIQSNKRIFLKQY